MSVTPEHLGAFLFLRPPRRIPPAIRRSATKSTLLWVILIGLFFICFSVPFMAIFFPWNLRNDLRLSWGKRAEADGLIIREAETNMSENGASVYRYEFRFTDAQGGEWTGACYKSGGGVLPSPPSGPEYQPPEGRVRVQYLPENPHVCRIAGCRLSPFAWPAGFVVVFPLVGLGLFLLPLGAHWRTRSLLSHGAFASGRVERIEETNVTVNGQRRFRIHVRFAGEGRAQHVSTAHAYGRDVQFLREKLQSGDPVNVLYRPGNPKRIFLADLLVGGNP